MPLSSFSNLFNAWCPRQWRLSVLVSVLLSALILSAPACAGGGPSDKDVLISLTDHVVAPAYQQAAADAVRLEQAAAELCGAPSEASLDTARQAWSTARASWLRTRALSFGPVMDRRSASLLDWSPTDTDSIDASIASAAFTATADVIRNSVSADRRGFGAMEHLLFNPDSLDSLSSSPPSCGYLSAVAQVNREETDALQAEWTIGAELGTPYKDYFTDRANLSVAPSDAGEEVVRVQVFMIRDLVQVRLAPALGLRGDGPDLTAIPGNAADNGLADLRNELLGMQKIYEGAGGEELGISHLVIPLSEETDQRVREQLASAILAVDEVHGPLRTTIAERPEQVTALYDRLSDVQRTMATEVVSLLGVSVGFSDTDGDAMR